MRYSVKEASEKIRVNPSTLKRWESLGWIEPPSRDYKGDRVYTEQDIKKLLAFKEQIRRPRKKKPKKG